MSDVTPRGSRHSLASVAEVDLTMDDDDEDGELSDGSSSSDRVVEVPDTPTRASGSSAARRGRTPGLSRGIERLEVGADRPVPFRVRPPPASASKAESIPALRRSGRRDKKP